MTVLATLAALAMMLTVVSQTPSSPLQRVSVSLNFEYLYRANLRFNVGSWYLVRGLLRDARDQRQPCFHLVVLTNVSHRCDYLNNFRVLHCLALEMQILPRRPPTPECLPLNDGKKTLEPGPLVSRSCLSQRTTLSSSGAVPSTIYV